jgi:hypothetical protein
VKRFLIVSMSCLFLALTSYAQQASNDSPASKEDVQRYLDAIHSTEMMKQIMQAMSKPMHDMVHQQYVKDQAKLPPDFESRMNGIMDDMLSTMPFGEMMQAMVPVYQKHFTHGDIDSLIAFYSAPIGQKILREMPAITSEAMQSMMPIMRRQMDAVMQRVQQEMAASLKGSPKVGHSPTSRN